MRRTKWDEREGQIDNYSAWCLSTPKRSSVSIVRNYCYKETELRSGGESHLAIYSWENWSEKNWSEIALPSQGKRYSYSHLKSSNWRKDQTFSLGLHGMLIEALARLIVIGINRGPIKDPFFHCFCLYSAANRWLIRNKSRNEIKTEPKLKSWPTCKSIN